MTREAKQAVAEVEKSIKPTTNGATPKITAESNGKKSACNAGCTCDPCNCNPCKCGDKKTDDLTNGTIHEEAPAAKTELVLEPTPSADTESSPQVVEEEEKVIVNKDCKCSPCRCDPCECGKQKNAEQEEPQSETPAESTTTEESNPSVAMLDGDEATPSDTTELNEEAHQIKETVPEPESTATKQHQPELVLENNDHQKNNELNGEAHEEIAPLTTQAIETHH